MATPQFEVLVMGPKSEVEVPRFTTPPTGLGKPSFKYRNGLRVNRDSSEVISDIVVMAIEYDLVPSATQLIPP